MPTPKLNEDSGHLCKNSFSTLKEVANEIARHNSAFDLDYRITFYLERGHSTVSGRETREGV